MPEFCNRNTKALVFYEKGKTFTILTLNGTVPILEVVILKPCILYAGGVALRLWFSPTNACKCVDLDEDFPLGTRGPGNEKSDSAIYDLILSQFPH